MPPSSSAAGRLGRRVALAVLLALAGGASAAAPPPPPETDALVSELDALRLELIGVVRTARQHERSIAELERVIAALDRDRAGRQRDLDESRREQEELLSALERLARNPPETLLFAPEGPLDRARSGVLLAAAVPQLAAEAQALAAEIQRVGTLGDELAEKRKELGPHREALAHNRELLARMIARRAELIRKLAPDDPAYEARVKVLATQAGDMRDLIARADAQVERRDKPSGKPATADRTKPQGVKPLDPQARQLLLPAAGDIRRRFGDPDSAGAQAPGIGVAALPQSEAIAPYDGQIVYAGPFRDRGVVLILRHDGGYHSVLAGLGRADARPGDWVLAGEPVGAMPQAPAAAAGLVLEMELWRDGRAIDPEPVLAGAEAAGATR